MKRYVKGILSYFGYELRRLPEKKAKTGYYSLFSPIRMTMKESLIHLKSLCFYPELIIDVGAADGTFPLLDVFPDTEYIWVEPLGEFEENLKRLKEKYKGFYIIAAAGKEKGEMNINLHDDLYGSSLLKESDGIKADGIQKKINIIKLDDILSEIISGKNGVLLKIDVQGAEIDVLEGSLNILDFIDVIILEVSLFKFHHHAPEFYDIIIYMKDKGYVVFDLFGGLNRPIDQALAQKDIMFVKEKGIFRTTHNFATGDQRKLIKEFF